MIKKIQKKNKKINNNESEKEKIKINKIIFKNFIPEKQVENKKKFILDENINNNISNNNKFLININKNNDKKNINNNIIKSNNNNINNIKSNEKINNIKIIKNDNNNNNINNINKNIPEKKEIKHKKKKSSYVTEKELQIAYEKKFLENINKEYLDKEYKEDMIKIKQDNKKNFMKENFPIMFQKDKFYLYSILPKKKLSTKEYYINPEYFDINDINKNKIILNENILNDDIKYLNNNNNNNNKIFNIIKTKKINNDKNYLYLYPKKVWSKESLKNKGININIDNFFEECEQIWPFDDCCFIQEIALEYLMLNNYSKNNCLNNIKDFVIFMKKRAKELDFPIISDSIKTIKKYHLRKTNNN